MRKLPRYLWRTSSRERAEDQAVRKRQRQLAAQRRRRAYFILAIVTGIMAILGWRLFYWQVLERETVLAKRGHTQVKSTEQPARGTIRDRNGYLLAVDTTEYSFAVSGNLIAAPQALAEQVAPIVEQPVEELAASFAKDDPYIPIATGLPLEAGQALINLDHSAFIVEPRLKRVYPNGSVAAHVLGFVNAEGAGYGLEYTFSDLLSGEVSLESKGPVAEEVKLGRRPFAPTRNGVDLVLTLDRNIQFMAEQELEYAIQRYAAEGGTIIVLQPHTGDVLAMANWPTYNPNTFATTDADLFINPAISEQYEPGSIFKAITIASVLDSGVVPPGFVYQDNGFIEVGGEPIYNWDGGARGAVTLTEILGYSVNTATAYLGVQLGIESFLTYVKAFGFGRPTGIELEEEVGGSIKEPGDGVWHPSDLGTNAFGQGLAVTPLQMVAAFTPFLNEGRLMRPRLIRAVVDHGRLIPREPVVAGHPIRPETARLMQSMLVEAVEIGMENAQIDDYRVGGKTGTAQIPIPGGYHPEDTIAGFVGFVPADEPTLLILVKLDKPYGEYAWGSQSAAPTFRRLAQRLLTYQNVPPDHLRTARSVSQTSTAGQQ